MAIYICSDIHGQYQLFKKMLEEIHFTDEDTLYIIGDIIDRGPESIEMIFDIMDRKNVFCTIGNHELMMLDFLTGEREGRIWLLPENGGIETYEQYKKLSEEDKKKVLNFIKDMYLQILVKENGQKFLLSHSSYVDIIRTIKINELAHHQIVYQSVWNSPWRFIEYEPLENYRSTGCTHIIGHVPVQTFITEVVDNELSASAFVDEKNHMVNIDLGCAYIDTAWEDGTEALCCMNLTEFAKDKESTKAFIYIKP